MAHFSKLDENNAVLKVHRVHNNVLLDDNGVEQEAKGVEFLTKLWKHPNWKQTSYNTHRGVHQLGGTPFRKNFGGKQYYYDEAKDAFIRKQPFPSWIFNEAAGDWDAPVPYPDDKEPGTELPLYPALWWDEDIQGWKTVAGDPIAS
tara:strand:+ start:746 stop:1183 length:438 start_codon:yes stop_codon:yes gene_type:complete